MEQALPKVLGILGGLGPMATVYFYEMLTRHTQAARDQDHIDIIINSRATTPDRTSYILGQSAENPFDIMAADAARLVTFGADVIAIPCNTSHYFADRLQGDIAIPLIHMPRETVAALAADGKKRAGILATDGTVQTGIYQRECAARGMEGVTPPADVQKLVMSIIYDEIKRGEKGSREKFAAIDRWLRGSGCDAAILGCTELSVYRTYHGLPDYYLDAMEILAERCITACGYKLRMV